MTLVALQPDTHVPFENKRAVYSFFEFLADQQPDRVVQIGDWADCVSVARWTTGTREEDGRQLQKEIDAFQQHAALLRSAYLGPVQTISGNHEDRLAKYLRTKAQGLYGLNLLTIPELFRYADWQIDPVRQPLTVAPKVVAVHGTMVRSESGASAKAELKKFGTCGVSGHTHRGGVFYDVVNSLAGTVNWWMECGHLSDRLQAHYLGPGSPGRWQQGFGLLHVDGQQVRPEFVPMDERGRFSWGGQRYGRT